MPEIKRVQVPRLEGLPGRSNGPGTGMRQADEGVDDPRYGALQELGKTVGNIGDLFIQKAEQQRKQDVELGQEKLLIDIENQGGKILNEFENAETPQQILQMADTYFEVDEKVGGRRLKGLWGYGDNLEDMDTSDDVLLNKYKNIGIRPEETAKFKLSRERYLNNVENIIAGKISEARFKVFAETKGIKDQRIVDNVRQGVFSFEEGLEAIISSYSDNGYPESVNAPMRESAIQFATKVYLEDEFDKGNLEVIQNFLDGEYYDELNNIYKQEDIINGLKDKAEAALSKYKIDTANVKYDPDSPEYDRDYNKIEKAVDSDKSLNADEKKEVLTTAQIEINRRNAADNKAKLELQNEQRNELSNLVFDGKTTEAYKFVDSMDAFEDHERNKMKADLAKGENIFQQFDPKQVKKIENHFKYLNENPSEVDMDKLFNVIQDAWGNGINETQKKGFLDRWRKIKEARDKKADPFNRDDFKNAVDRIEDFAERGGYLPLLDGEIVTPGDISNTPDKAEAWAVSDKVTFEKIEQLKAALENDQNLNIADWLQKNLTPQEEKAKENQVMKWLNNAFGLTPGIKGINMGRDIREVIREE